MSKLLDKLEKLARGNSTPMGFARRSERDRTPGMICVGIVRAPGKDGLALPPSALDAVLVADSGNAKAMDKFTQGLGELPWGVWVSAVDKDSAAAWKSKGCDFLVCSAEATQLEALGQEDMAYFLSIPADLDDRSLRVIESLPVDGVFLSTEALGLPLTLQHLILIGTLRSMFDKYMLVEVPAAIGKKELEHIRGLGVDGIAVNAAGLTPEDLQQLHQKLVEVGRSQPRRGKVERPTPLLPRISIPTPVTPQQEEEEEEDQ